MSHRKSSKEKRFGISRTPVETTLIQKLTRSYYIVSAAAFEKKIKNI
jgi:hypothetical protein